MEHGIKRGCARNGQTGCTMKSRLWTGVAVATVLLAYAESAVAQNPPVASTPSATQPAIGDKPPPGNGTQEKLDSLGFGIAFGSNFLASRRAVDASLGENNVVRIDKDRSQQLRLLAEIHALPICTYHWWKKNAQGERGEGYNADDSCKYPRSARFGFFGALQLSGDGALSAMGGGVMWAFPRGRDATGAKSLNLGIGVLFEPNIKVLGDGLTANKPLPAGFTTLRTKETSAWSGMVTLGFGW